MKKNITKYLNQPRFLRHLMNWYGPYRGAGVKIRHLADDFSSATVEMPLRWYNRNYVGVHFGGSLYSMVDPFHMLLIMNQLGSDYVVWDKEATIEFISPGTGTVTAHFEVDQATIQDILDKTKDNQKYLPVFTVDVLDEDGTLVARAKKTIHVRKKRGK
jgi:acyl-coenzyme A thioesterase PaaI-like protein